MMTSTSNPAAPWSSFRSYLLLAIATVFCLAPFSNKAFHIDDTLFLYAAQHITQHPFDPYGFEVNWYRSPIPMWMETKNPPLACYVIAAAGKLFGWSERPLHLVFMLPALFVVLSTYYMARRMTKSPLFAAAATLLTPVFLVSANTLMCDTLMLAFWMAALVLWVEGMDRDEPALLTVAAVLVGVAGLTKYFGIALVGLLLAYSWVRQRRLGDWAWCLAIPVLMMAAYQQWTWSLDYGHMFGGAVRFARIYRRNKQASLMGNGLIDLSFLGGCVLPALLLTPFLWKRRWLAIGAVCSGLAGFTISRGWVNLGEGAVLRDYHQLWVRIGLEATIFVAGGFTILALAIEDVWKRRDADSVLLSAWVLGTFVFAGFVNWTNNGRSILPVVPAVGILLARRADELWPSPARLRTAKLAVVLALSGVLSLWVAWADASVANSARSVAEIVRDKTRNQSGTVWFVGHWGFQYYMQLYGAHAVDVDAPEVQPGDFIAIPRGNARFFEMRPRFVAQDDLIQIDMPGGISSMQENIGAGFYSSDNGPLPFAIGSIPPERYDLYRVSVPRDWGKAVILPAPKPPFVR